MCFPDGKTVGSLMITREWSDWNNATISCMSLRLRKQP